LLGCKVEGHYEKKWSWQFAPLQFDCVACMMCQCAVLLKTKLSSAICLTAVNIWWDSVVKYLTDNVCWLSMLAEKTLITDMAPDIMADMVNADCVHIRWLDALCPVLVMFGAHSWSFYECRILCLRSGDIFDVFCVFVSKSTHNI